MTTTRLMPPGDSQSALLDPIRVQAAPGAAAPQASRRNERLYGSRCPKKVPVPSGEASIMSAMSILGSTPADQSAEPAAVVLLSGGLDSATVLAMAQSEGFRVHAISFSYGQRHSVELDAAAAIARKSGVARHAVIEIDLRVFGGSALTAEIDVPKHDTVDELTDEIPVTYVPARNTIFLSYALGYAEVLEADHIFMGVNALDYSGYPDCRPEFIEAFQTTANLATKRGVEGGSLEIHTPLISLTKAETVRRGLALGVDYGLTRSCYDPAPTGEACGHCDSCLLRLRAFADNGMPDPAPYQATAQAA